MIPARRFGHVVLAVRDMKKSSEFYAMAVGLRVAAYNESRGQCFMSFGDDHHTLGLFQRAAPDGAAPSPEQPGILRIAFEMEGLPAIRAARARLAEAGVAVESGGTRGIRFRDPDGNGVELDVAAGAVGRRRISHLVLNVRDVARSRDFYLGILGLGVVSEEPDEGVCLLGLDGRRRDLALVQRVAADAPPPDETQPRMIHFAWQLEDFAEVQAKYRELVAQGIAVDTVLHNVTQSLYVTDPDGHVCELYCDRWEDGFEAMSTQGPMTRRLDIETGEGIGEDVFAAKAREDAGAG